MKLSNKLLKLAKYIVEEDLNFFRSHLKYLMNNLGYKEHDLNFLINLENDILESLLNLPNNNVAQQRELINSLKSKNISLNFLSNLFKELYNFNRNLNEEAKQEISDRYNRHFGTINRNFFLIIWGELKKLEESAEYLSEELEDEIGKGAFGKVYREKDKAVYTKIVKLEDDQTFKDAFELYSFLQEQGDDFYKKVHLARIYSVKKIGPLRLEIKMEPVTSMYEYMGLVQENKIDLPRTLKYKSKESNIEKTIQKENYNLMIDIFYQIIDKSYAILDLPQKITLDSGKTVKHIDLDDRNPGNIAVRMDYPQKGTDYIVHIDLDFGALQ